ncbi:MAG: hypothetical protein ABSB87_15725 [Terriglobales bacterium]|jgi:uncharacterized membrane protein
MTRPTLKNFVLALSLLGTALIPSTSLAQVGLASKLPGKRPASAAAQAASHQAKTAGSPSYTYTLLSFPGALLTSAASINLGATTSKTEIVGGYGPPEQGNLAQGGFLARVSGTKAVAESYKAVNYPHLPQDQIALGVNDSGQIVGTYYTSENVFYGYELSDGKFTTLSVPGGAGTLALGINNSGEVVGYWGTSGGPTEGFMLIGGTYTSFNYPGASATLPISVNNEGEIVGNYTDTSGVTHGFSLSGGTYTSFDVPGSVGTYAEGINDAGNIVGTYCTTAECISTYEGMQGFLLSNGAFTTIAVPGESYTWVNGINNNGVMVGYYQDAAGLEVSFLATP